MTDKPKQDRRPRQTKEPYDFVKTVLTFWDVVRETHLEDLKTGVPTCYGEAMELEDVYWKTIGQLPVEDRKWDMRWTYLLRRKPKQLDVEQEAYGVFLQACVEWWLRWFSFAEADDCRPKNPSRFKGLFLPGVNILALIVDFLVFYWQQSPEEREQQMDAIRRQFEEEHCLLPELAVVSFIDGRAVDRFTCRLNPFDEPQHRKRSREALLGRLQEIFDSYASGMESVYLSHEVVPHLINRNQISSFVSTCLRRTDSSTGQRTVRSPSFTDDAVLSRDCDPVSRILGESSSPIIKRARMKERLQRFYSLLEHGLTDSRRPGSQSPPKE